MNRIKRLLIIFSIIIISITAIVGIYFFIKDRKEKAFEQKVIEYCEKYKWNEKYIDPTEEMNFFNSDDVGCIDFLYLKPKVKKSTSNICHIENSTYYYRTKNYKKYNTIEECLKSGGRLPKN